MAMNIHNLDEMVEDFNKQEKKIKEVDEQLSSADKAIEYYKEEIETKMAERRKDLKMKDVSWKKNGGQSQSLNHYWEKYILTIFCLFFPLFSFYFIFHINS